MRTRYARTTRGVALFLAGILASGLFMTPAGAHINRNTGHVWRHIRGKADPRYINVNEQVRLLANGVVTSSKIAGGEVRNVHIASDAVTKSKISSNSVGASELRTFTRASATASRINPGESPVVTAECPVGSRVISGGPSAVNTSDLSMVRSAPNLFGTGWFVEMKNDSGMIGEFSVRALCLAT